MTNSVTGVVEKIVSRGSAWDIYVDNKRYGHGFTAPTFSKGDTVSFDVTEKPWKDKVIYNVVLDSVKVVPVSETPKAKSAAPAPAAQTEDKPSREYWDAKDQRICYAGCQEDAIALVGIAIANEAIKLPKTENKRLGVLIDAVNKVSEQLYQRVQGMEYNAVLPSDDDAVEADDAQEEEVE